MKINIFYDNNYSSPFVFNDDEILEYSKNILEFAINNNLSDLYTCKFDYEFDVMLCGNDFIHKINKEYRKIDKPTDVITFAMFSDSTDKIVNDNVITLGQIIISADKVKSQALENKVTEKYEFLNLLSHGILHLLGFDHTDDNLLNNMLELQSKMIESVNNVKI